MSKLLQVGVPVNSRKGVFEELMKTSVEKLSMDVKVQFIRDIIPIVLLYVLEVLGEEVKALTGDKHKRNGIPGHVKWGRQWGSIYLGEQKVPVKYQRVRDRRARKEVELKSYKALQSTGKVEDGIFRKVLHGLSCRRYEECSELLPGAFGLSSSSISRRFIRASARKLKALNERSLKELDIVAVFIDGKSFYEDEMIIALGITMKGEKVILGFIQSGSENSTVCKDLLNGLISRGLRIEEGLLCIIDGSKGLRKAIEEAFSGYAVIQRCQWHKRENVISYLPKRLQAHFRKKLQKAYEEPTYEKAREALSKVKKELLHINGSAVSSLEEGLEETLTLHRLGLFEKLGKSFKTTNCIESVMSQIGQKTDKVDRWRNSDQKRRWLASALLDIEPRLKKVRGYKHLSELKNAIQLDLGLKEEERMAA